MEFLASTFEFFFFFLLLSFPSCFSEGGIRGADPLSKKKGKDYSNWQLKYDVDLRHLCEGMLGQCTRSVGVATAEC